VNPTRADIAHRAVWLINPDESMRSACINAVHVALVQLTITDADLRYMARRQSKRAKRATDRLQKALKRLQAVLADPELPDDVRNAFPRPWTGPDVIGIRETDQLLTDWLNRADAALIRKEKLRQPKAMRKLVAAEQAFYLLKRFNRKIAITKGSPFCRLAALLNGTPKADFQFPCREVSNRLREQH
jgi:hypothetical protein